MQTLSEAGFDAGTVLAQTPPPGMAVPPDCTTAQLRDLLAPQGAEMLVCALRRRLHVRPHEDAGWMEEAAATSSSEGRVLVHAPKIAPADSCVRWTGVRGRDGRPDEGSWSAAEMALRARVFGMPWSRLVPARHEADGQARRKASGGDDEADADGPVQLKRVKFEEVNELRPVEWPRSVAEFYHRVKTALADAAASSSGLEARIDLGALSMVDFARGPPRAGGSYGAHPQSPLREDVATVPYFPDGDAVVLPMAGGGCVKVRKIQVEGGTSRPAAVVLRSFTRGVSSETPTADEADSVLRGWVTGTEGAEKR